MAQASGALIYVESWRHPGWAVDLDPWCAPRSAALFGTAGLTDSPFCRQNSFCGCFESGGVGCRGPGRVIRGAIFTAKTSHDPDHPPTGHLPQGATGGFSESCLAPSASHCCWLCRFLLLLGYGPFFFCFQEKNQEGTLERPDAARPPISPLL